MSEDEYVTELRSMLLALNPVGTGSGARVGAVRIVHDSGFDELEIEFSAVIDGHDRGSGRTRVDIDREWCELSGYDDPGAYVRVVVRALERAVHQVTRGWTDPVLDPDAAWDDLLRNLAYHGTVHEVAAGRIEVTDEDGDVLTVVVTREQWAEVWAHESDDFFHDLLGPRHRDETFVVFHRGDLVASVREQLPPVESLEFRKLHERMLRSREEAVADDPNAKFGWYAVRPDGSQDWFRDAP